MKRESAPVASTFTLHNSTSFSPAPLSRSPLQRFAPLRPLTQLTSLAAFLLFALLLSSCGGSSSNSGSNPGGSNPPPAATLKSIAISPANPSIAITTTEQFKATGTYSDSSTKDLTASVSWKSASTAVATIATGSASGTDGLATGVAVGNTKISASLNSVASSTVLTVTPPPPQVSSVTVVPSNPIVVLGAPVQLTATAHYIDGSTQNVTSSADWSSSNTTFATVNSTGLVTGVAAGTSTVSASIPNGSNTGNATGSSSVTVQTSNGLPTGVGWHALPDNTELQASGQCPANNFGGDPFLFTEYCANVIRAWSGAVADTTANRLIIWGGGHNNYYGNEIYALNLTANPIALVRLKDPTVPTNFENSSNCIDGIPPGSPNFAPNSRESYAGMAFLPTAYRMYIEGGSVACLLGDQSQNTWTIPLSGLSSSTSWVHENPTISGPTPGSDGGFTYGNIADYDPNSGLIFLSDSAAIYTYNYSKNTYTMVSPSQGFVTSIYLSGAIDPTRKLFVLVGGSCGNGSCGPGDGVFVADISDPTSTTQQNWTTNTLADPVCAEFLAGGVNPINTSNPGITFDSVANDFVAWPNQGNSIYILTPDVANQRLTCTKQTFANGPPNSAHHSDEPNTSYGTFGRLRYFPALDAFVLINDWNIPAYILRLRGSSPTPDFSLSATPGSNSVVQGKSTSYTVNAGAIGSFSGSVGLSVSGLPSGATASLSPTSVTTSGSSTLSVATTTSTAAGSYALTITGKSGSLSHTASVTLVVTSAPPPANFALTAGPASDSVVQGSKATYTATVTGQNGFTGNVALSVTGAPTGATASFSPASISTSGSSTLTVSTTALTAAGSYTLTITGTSGSITQHATVGLTVTDAGGGGSSSGGVISVKFVGSGAAMASSEVAGVVPKDNWNQAKGASSTSAMSLVDQNGAATGATITWTADNGYNLPIADQPGNVRM